MSSIVDPIPSGPFMRWLNDQIAETSMREVVELIGWNRTNSTDAGLRRLYRYRHGRSETTRGRSRGGSKGHYVVLPATHFERSVVEDALHFADVDLEDLYPRERYPALYEDIPLEPERWCPGCQESVTPIYGVCGWCEWSFREMAA